MQSLAWYTHRLQAMSRQEMLWRLGTKFREPIDRLAAPVRRKGLSLKKSSNGNGRPLAMESNVVGRYLPTPGERPKFSPQTESWFVDLIGLANKILQNRLPLFDLQDLYLGDAIDWNYEYKARKGAPLSFAPAIDYRDYSLTGDCKFVWELNRHQHLVVLGRAYRLTGERSYAEAVIEHLESWIRQCPYGMGMNWRSPLELAVRLINWVWALELIRPSGVLTPHRAQRVFAAAYAHLWEISRNYSRFSSANNHLIGEAAGVFIGSSYFPDFKKASQRQEHSRQILLEEIFNQTYSDGGSREQAMGYHLFALEFFLLAGLVARNVGRDFPDRYWKRLEKMFDFAGAFSRGDSQLPMFGDCDDGYVLDLGGANEVVRGLMAVAAVLFDRGDFKALSRGFSEPAFWLLGKDGYDGYEQIETPTADGLHQSRGLPESGYYLLRSGSQGNGDGISICFDCGELGLGPIAAHGHADALSFSLRAFDQDVFVDPGTYDYFTYPKWRNYFRGTQAHNTVMIDEVDQSEMLGSFLWGRRAKAQCVRWDPQPDGGTVIGRHDGYAHLPGSVQHSRAVTLEGCKGEVLLHDEIRGKGRHTAAAYFHLAPQCSVEQLGENRLAVRCDGGSLVLAIDSGLSVSIFRGSEQPILGWVSTGYHRKEPSITIEARSEWEDQIDFVTRIFVGNC